MKDTGIHKAFQPPKITHVLTGDRNIKPTNRQILPLQTGKSYRDTETLKNTQNKPDTLPHVLPPKILKQALTLDTEVSQENSNPLSVIQMPDTSKSHEIEIQHSASDLPTEISSVVSSIKPNPSVSVSQFKKPFSFLNVVLAPKQPEKESTEIQKYFKILLTRKSSRKHKKYEDGVLVITRKKSTLFNMEGKKMIERPSSIELRELQVNDQVTLGMYEIEVDLAISKEDYISGKCFLNQITATISKPKTTEIKQATPRSLCIPENAFPLDLEKGVYIEEFLNEKLRPHQREGIQFMYECIMGYKSSTINGCILADSMGLGKTLQSIALLYTLSRKNASYDPIVKKVIIVSPSSLVNNWKQEILKWLGPVRLNPIACIGNKKEVDNLMSMFIKG